MKSITFTFLVFQVSFAGCNTNPGRTKEEKIEYVIQQAVEAHDFVGSVLVADQGKVIYKKAFGKADYERDIPNTDSTRYLIASLSKPLTAILILKLVEQGKLRFEDPVNKFFEMGDRPAGYVTIHQLLTHTSGIQEFISKEEDQPLEAMIKNMQLQSAPGAEFSYLNSGYVLLKAIAETVTGRSYKEMIGTFIVEPAGMQLSGVADSPEMPGLAKGYEDATQARVEEIDYPLKNVEGAGSLYATVEDLYRLDRILYTDSILSTAMREQMLMQHVREKFSYGWYVRERSGLWDVYWHKGNLPGFTSFISRRIKKDQLIVLLSNAGNLGLDDLENDIARILKTE